MTEKGTVPVSMRLLWEWAIHDHGHDYMAVEGGGTETATWATPQTSLSIYWGSIDGDTGDGILNLNSLRSRLMVTR